MIDPIFAVVTTFEFLLTVGFVLYCVRLVTLFGMQTKVGRAWLTMVVAGLILLGIGGIALGQSFELISNLPVWWRELSAVLFRAWLFLSVIMIFRSWTKVD